MQKRHNISSSIPLNLSCSSSSSSPLLVTVVFRDVVKVCIEFVCQYACLPLVSLYHNSHSLRMTMVRSILAETTFPVRIRPRMETSPVKGHFLSMYVELMASLGVYKIPKHQSTFISSRVLLLVNIPSVFFHFKKTHLESQSYILVPTSVLSSNLLGRNGELGVVEQTLLLERLLNLLGHNESYEREKRSAFARTSIPLFVPPCIRPFQRSIRLCSPLRLVDKITRTVPRRVLSIERRLKRGVGRVV